MGLDAIAQLGTVLCLYSIAAERVVEIISSIVNFEGIKNEKLRSALKQIIAAIAGASLYYMNGEHAIPVISQNFSTISGAVFIGLVTSGGSGFWNTILKNLRK